MSEGNTSKVIEWALAHPVLARRLRMIAEDGVKIQDGDQELSCTIADLLDPDRKILWADYLQTTGAPSAEADALWAKLGGIAGIYAVDWREVRVALLALRELES